MDTTILYVIELLILFFTAGTTLYIYKSRKCTERQHAASIIVMQVDSIDNNVDLAMNMLGNNGNGFSVPGFWKSEIIIQNNLWEKYRHLFVKELDYNQIVSLNLFYESAISMANQQREIKMLISNINREFYIKNSNLEKEEFVAKVRDCEPYIRCSSMYLETMQEQYRIIAKRRREIPYEQLKKIARLQFTNH